MPAADRDRQTITAADVGTIPAALAALLDKSKVDGVGTFTPPQPDTLTPPARQPGESAEAAERTALLMQHKLLGAQIAQLKADRTAVEARIGQLDARLGLAMKLAGLTPAERELLEQTLAEKAQQRIDAQVAPPAEAGAPADGPGPTPGA